MSEAKIRPTVLLRIRETIERTSFFAFHDFKLISEESYQSKIRIEYLHKETSWLTVRMPSSKTKAESGAFYYSFDGEHSPGEVHVTESFSARELEGFLHVVNKWLNLLREDLINEPTRRALESQQQQIESLMETVGEIDDNYFTAQEAEKMRERLDALEQRFEQELRNEKAIKKDELEKRIGHMTAQVEALKQQVGALQKRAWWRVFLGRFVSWSSDPKNQKLLESGVTTVKQLLGENPSGPSQ